VLCTQNQVAPGDLGAASSVVTFFRSLGGAIGVSALGAVLSHRISHYAQEGLAKLGVSPSATGHGEIPDLDALPTPIRSVIESAYGHGIGDVFLYAAPFAVLALVFSLFIKEVPLRTTGALAQAAQAPQTNETLPAATPATATATEETAATAEHPAAVTAPARVSGGGTAVRGHVRGAEGTPVPRAAVTLISLGGRQLGRSVAGADGTYTVDAPAPGSYVLIAAADGFQPQASTVVVGGEPVAYDILLSGTSGLSGVVRAAGAGSAVQDAMVVVTDVRGDVLASGVTGEQGEFGFGELVPGGVTVAVNAAGFRPRALPVEVGGTGMTRIEIDLEAGARLQGVVRAPGGVLADARVTLVDAAGNVVGTATTGTDGAYAFTDLDSGEYTVIATGYPPLATALTVAGPGVDGHDIELAHPGE
jgi:protocatechuate 3,4-dioxygenase beta subunit